MIVTYVIIGITSIVSWYAYTRPELMRRFIFNPYQVNTNKERYRFLSSALLHGSFMHLLFNMISLYFFGVQVERFFGFIFGSWGTLYFIALYVLSVIVSDIPTYFRQRHNPAYNSLGASGGVSAIVFAFILFLPTQNICLYYFLCMPGFLLGAGFLVYSYINSRRAHSVINHEAHLYGALFGLVYCIVLYPQSVPAFFAQLSEWKLF
jgi:membrane associated rhomboid family serine protease